jgi:hypothetical protein
MTIACTRSYACVPHGLGKRGLTGWAAAAIFFTVSKFGTPQRLSGRGSWGNFSGTQA